MQTSLIWRSFFETKIWDEGFGRVALLLRHWGSAIPERDMVTTKAICLEQIVWIWDDGLQTHFNSIGEKCETKCKWRRPCGGYHYVHTHSGEFDLHDHHKAKFELCNWSGESIHANTTKATFGCSEAHTEIHKTYFVVWNFLRSQEPITSTWIHGCWLG